MKLNHPLWRAVVLCCLLWGLFCLSACSSGMIYDGVDKMTLKARQELGLTENKTLSIIGEFADGKNHIFWFVSGDEANGRTYYPLEFQHVEAEKYRFVKVHTNIDRAPDISIVYWHDQYCFLINNPDCAYLDIEENGEGLLIKPDTLPYISNYPAMGDFTYTFFDKNFEEIKN